ncbi:hypothetical protein OF83DRAFT_1285583 [Amylostereum chailletii]|nr:hypothetical protein OF83DRAFT_1285583 [Amylostereum chailletii]
MLQTLGLKNGTERRRTMFGRENFLREDRSFILATEDGQGNKSTNRDSGQHTFAPIPHGPIHSPQMGPPEVAQDYVAQGYWASLASTASFTLSTVSNYIITLLRYTIFAFAGSFIAVGIVGILGATISPEGPRVALAGMIPCFNYSVSLNMSCDGTQASLPTPAAQSFMVGAGSCYIQAGVSPRTKLPSTPRRLIEDFGSANAGASIIHELTSPTYVPQTRVDVRALKRLMPFFTTPSSVPTSPSVIISYPPIHPQICWPFHGTTGTVGIRLSHNVTISHVITSFGEAKHLRHASPRLLTLWGIVPSHTSSHMSIPLSFMLSGLGTGR